MSITDSEKRRTKRNAPDATVSQRKRTDDAIKERLKKIEKFLNKVAPQWRTL
jgi:hypothetical protein